MFIHVTDPYLWLPVDQKAPEVKLHFYCDDSKIQEVDIQLGGPDRNFYVSMNVSKYLGRDILIEGDVEEEKLASVFCYGEKARYVYPFRPQIHFSPETGWINDPNGLVFADGVYHLYYQWNPYGIIWGNMHWGHAVSRDLITWEHRPMAMEPDEYGPVFSGCGWQDKENAAGFGKNALLFFYTASGGNNQWSIDAGNRHTQRLAVSLDGGETLRKTEGTILDHMTDGNRDPKIFYHHKSGAYVMVLFLDGYEFAVFRSADLLRWHETQRFSAEGMRECPDLFELSVANVPDEKKWVFWSADGYYLVGDFDGSRFTPESEILSAYGTRLPYAAQTYAGTGDRTISVAWLRTETDRGNYKGMMSLPSELSLVKCDNVYRIRFGLTKEFMDHRLPYREAGSCERGLELRLKGKPVEVVLKCGAEKTGHAGLIIGNVRFDIQFDKGRMEILHPGNHPETVAVSFEPKKAFDMDWIIDQGVIEFYGNDGLIYGAVEPEENILHKSLVLEVDAELETMQIYTIQNNTM